MLVLFSRGLVLLLGRVLYDCLVLLFLIDGLVLFGLVLVLIGGFTSDLLIGVLIVLTLFGIGVLVGLTLFGSVCPEREEYPQQWLGKAVFHYQ